MKQNRVKRKEKDADSRLVTRITFGTHVTGGRGVDGGAETTQAVVQTSNRLQFQNIARGESRRKKPAGRDGGCCALEN